MGNEEGEDGVDELDEKEGQENTSAGDIESERPPFPNKYIVEGSYSFEIGEASVRERPLA